MRTDIKFIQWLKIYLKEHGRTNAIADFAADAKQDKCFPKTSKNYKCYFEHITIKHTASFECIRAFNEAFKMYNNQCQLDLEYEEKEY